MATLTNKKFVDLDLLKLVVNRIGSKAAGNLDSAKTYAESLVNALRGGYDSTIKALADLLDAEVTRATDAEGVIKALAEANKKAISDHATEFTNFKTANTQAIATAKSEAITAANGYTDSIKAMILGDGVTEAFDTLKEVEDWIKSHGEEAANIIADVKKNADDIAAHATEFASFKTANTQAIATAKSEAITAAATDATTKVNALRNEISFATTAEVEAALTEAGFTA